MQTVTLKFQSQSVSKLYFIAALGLFVGGARAHDLGLDQEEEAAEDDGKVETGDTDRGHATPAARDDDEESAI